VSAAKPYYFACKSCDAQVYVFSCGVCGKCGRVYFDDELPDGPVETTRYGLGVIFVPHDHNEGHKHK
jgi:hypothetical protein